MSHLGICDFSWDNIVLSHLVVFLLEENGRIELGKVHGREFIPTRVSTEHHLITTRDVLNIIFRTGELNITIIPRLFYKGSSRRTFSLVSLSRLLL